jgi:hypothetical protein
MSDQKFAIYKHSPIEAFTFESIPEKKNGVKDIIKLEVKGPWKTKSEAYLSVLFALPYPIVQSFFDYDQNELQNIPMDIRGLRSYSVKNVLSGKIGGGEFHRVRNEILFATSGIVKVSCVDLTGDKNEFIVDQSYGLYIPPFIMHTYEAIETADLLVIANTLFDPADPLTHDTFGWDVFNKLLSL